MVIDIPFHPAAGIPAGSQNEAEPMGPYVCASHSHHHADERRWNFDRNWGELPVQGESQGFEDSHVFARDMSVRRVSRHSRD